MKTDREFLTSMWAAVDETEYEEKQKLLARQKSRDISRKYILLYLLILCAGAAVLLFSRDTEGIYNGAIYGIAFILLMAAYFIDQIYFTNTRRAETR